MTALGEQLKKDYPNQYPPTGLEDRALAEEGRQTIRPALRFVLAGAVALVLLIACSNIANLLLCAAAARARELAIPHGLGATRATLVVQMLAKASVLSIAGRPRPAPRYGALRPSSRSTRRTFHGSKTSGIDTVVLVFPASCRVGTASCSACCPRCTPRAPTCIRLREGGRSNVGDGGTIVRRGLVGSPRLHSPRAARLRGPADPQLRPPESGKSLFDHAQPGHVETSRAPPPSTPRPRSRRRSGPRACRSWRRCPVIGVAAPPPCHSAETVPPALHRRGLPAAKGSARPWATSAASPSFPPRLRIRLVKGPGT